MTGFNESQSRITVAGRFAILSLFVISLVAVGIAPVIGYYLPPVGDFPDGAIWVALAVGTGTLLLFSSLLGIFSLATRSTEAQHQAWALQSRQELASQKNELAATHAKLQEAQRMAAVGHMVLAVAHGIRSPLANIRAWAQTAMLECRNCHSSVLGPKSLAITMTEADRLEARLREMFQFVWNPEWPTGLVDLNLLLRRTLETRTRQIEDGRIEVDDQLASSLPLTKGDPLATGQVLVSLIDNAIEAMPEGGGTMTLVSGTETDGAGALSVFAEIRDTGVGIPPHELPKIMQPFYTTKPKGTGLGLAIAKKFTESQGGAMKVSSQQGKGTTFRLTFPAQPVPDAC